MAIKSAQRGRVDMGNDRAYMYDLEVGDSSTQQIQKEPNPPQQSLVARNPPTQILAQPTKSYMKTSPLNLHNPLYTH